MPILSFPPVIGEKPIVLILGTMPGKRSLEAMQYFAHPRNQFWKIMGEIIGFDPNAPYPMRLRKLMDSHIALWDSLNACEREGSLDQDIVESTEIPNDVKGMIAEHPTIKTIAFNGKKSWRAFRHHILPGLTQETLEELILLPMPSTSPANARMAYEDKLEHWSIITSFLNEVQI
jgi:TDG/mug DNA glycosylase family protein